MKQNIDCMKGILRVLEDSLSIYCVESDFYIEKIGMNKLIELMEEKASGFSREEIAYSALQLIQRNYVMTTGMDITPGKTLRISFGSFLYITPEGYDFLNS